MLGRRQMQRLPTQGAGRFDIGMVVIDKPGALCVEPMPIGQQPINGWIGLAQLDVAGEDTAIEKTQKVVPLLDRPGKRLGHIREEKKTQASPLLAQIGQAMDLLDIGGDRL